MKLDDLPYEPDCSLEPTVLKPDLNQRIEVPRTFLYDTVIEGWQLITDCEGQPVAIVPQEIAEKMRDVVNQAYEEFYTDANK